jgi:hypothetical protein
MSVPVKARLRQLICYAVIAAPLAAFGQGTTTISYDNLNVDILDNDPNGVQNSQTVAGLQGSISSIQVGLMIAGTGSGAFNGDYFVELVNDAGGFAVLLNRSGVSSANPYGYSDNGFNVTFSDSAANGIHFYQNGAYTWRPDGENISPWSSVPSDYDAQNQTAMLSSFIGEDPNRTWTLLLADVSDGGTGQLVGWSLTITTVPEPPETGLLVLGLIVGAWLLRSQKRHGSGC